MTGLTSLSNSATSTRWRRRRRPARERREPPRPRRRARVPERGPPRAKSSCKDSIKRDAALVARRVTLATVRGEPAVPKLLLAIARARPRRLRAGARRRTRRSSRATCRCTASARSRPRRRPARFNLVGLHWRGAGTVQFRTRSLAGRWSGWREAAPEAEDGPTPARAERARARQLAARQPLVGRRRPTGSSTASADGSTRLRAYFVWSPRRGRSARARCRRPARRRSCRGAAGAPTRRSGVGTPAFASRAAARGRAPHGRRERLHAGAVAGDRARRSSSTT